jgi:hypothetical protein
MAPTKCIRGNVYSDTRVDVAAAEISLGTEIARGGGGVVYRGTFGGVAVAVKKPKLSTTDDMDRYHRELQARGPSGATSPAWHARRTVGRTSTPPDLTGEREPEGGLGPCERGSDGV